MIRKPLNFKTFAYVLVLFINSCWPAISYGQTNFLVVPNYAANSQIGNSADAQYAINCRAQTVFGAEEFPPYPIIISKLQWRPDIFTGGPITNASIANIQINLSTTTGSADHLNSVFAQNIGPDDTIVFNGTLNLSTALITLSNGTTAFDMDVPLLIPFTYDPSKGNLLVDVQNFTGCTKNIYDNSTDSGSDTVSRIVSSNPLAASADFSDSGGGVMQITYSAIPTPTIISQPTNLTVSINGSAIFAVVTAGAQPFSYQWYFNDTNNPIDGATNTSLLLSNVQTNQAGIYFVRVTNGYGSTVGSNALLTVLPMLLTSQPADQFASPGETATFSVTVSSSLPVIYQWYFNDTNLIAGATNSSLIVTNVQFDSLGLYSVRTTNLGGSVNSSNALLTFRLVVPKQSATNQIHDSDGSFNSILRQDTVYAASEFPPYPITIVKIRLRPDIDAGGPLSMTLPSTQFSFSTTQAKPDQLSSTFSQNIGTNNTVVFSGALNISTSFITLTNGTKAFDIQIPFQQFFLYDPSQGNLLLDFRNFNGSTPSVGNFVNLATGTDGTSRLYTSNPNGASGFGDTGGYVMEVGYRPAPALPNITSQPTNRLVAAGTSAVFTVSASAGLPLGYQWFFNDFDHPLENATNSSLTLLNVQTNQTGSYFVQVTDSFGSIASFPATLTVVSGPLIASQPISQVVAAGETATFTVTAQGGTPMNYQWFFNNTNIILDATNSSIVISNAQTDEVGNYSVRVANIYGSVISSNAGLRLGLIIPNYSTNYQIANNGEAIFVGVSREQTVYGASQFPQYPIVITELRWRPDSIAGGPLTDSVPNIQITLSTTATNADHMSTTFSKNVGTNDTIVFSGTMTALTSFITLSNGTKAFDIPLVLQTPFIFDPSKGNLLLDLRDFGGGTANLYNNTVSTSTDVVSRVYNAGNASAISATGSDTGGGALQIIYTPAPVAPTISAQPTNRAVVVGGTASFSVGAGPQPLSYQWFYNTNTVLDGETNSSLVLTNVQFNQSGTYSVVVSNVYGPTVSTFALLTASFPPVNVLVGSTNALGGNSFTIPVFIAANGNENSVSFSLNFDTQRVSYAGIELGSGAADGSLLLNTGQTANGRLGVTMLLPPGETFTPGTQEVVRVTFLSALVSGTQIVTPISFTNSPIDRLVRDAQNNRLATNFINGSVTLAVSDLESDTSPRSSGDRSLDIFDWTQVGRFVAGLDVITNAAEFQRADVAPKSTSGDGQLKVADWVQAGRYGSAVDAPTVVGGPTAPVAPTTLTGGPRTVNVAGGTGVKGLNITVPIVLQSQGNENGLGFSVNFNPAVLKYVSTTKGSAAGSGTLLVNTNQAAAGTVGVLVALQTGSSFTNGIPQEVAKLTFTALNTVSNGPVALVNGPVLLSISDPLANELAANYSNGVVTINPPPTVTAGVAGSNVTLTWPIWGTGFNVQGTGDLLNQGWTNVAYSAQTNGNEIIITIPAPTQNSYYRLQHP